MSGDIGDLILWLAGFQNTLDTIVEPIEASGVLIRRESGQATRLLLGSMVGSRIVTSLAGAYNSNARTLGYLEDAENDARDALNQLRGL